MIKYLGSKRVLLPRIVEIASSLPEVRSVCDLFTGTTRVAQEFKRLGYAVHANDVTAFSVNLARTFIETDASVIDFQALRSAIDRLNQLPGTDGYFTTAFAEEARYFQPANARKIDAIREAIDLEPESLRPILLTALMLAADRVDSTTGLQMAYLKQWSARSNHPLSLEVPNLIAGQGIATGIDALDLAKDVSCDLVYLDPPYNQHSYLGNYHVWESLVLNDRPERYGIANKRIDCRTRKSPFNTKRDALGALEHVIHSLRSKYVILSFNDEGFVRREALEEVLSAWGDVTCEAVPYRRYVGAQIGIHNLRGEKVGSVGKLHNHEFLFVARRHG